MSAASSKSHTTRSKQEHKRGTQKREDYRRQEKVKEK
jgi:hypothetical protein